GVCEIVHVHTLHVGFALAEIKPLDVVLLPLMNVDSLWMDGGKGGRKIYLSDHLRLSILLARSIDDDEIVGRHRTQADRVRRIALLHPVPVASAPLQVPCFSKSLAQFRQFHIAELLIGREWELEGGTLQMVHENLQVVWLNVCVLGRTPKKVVRMLHDELVERRRRRNEHRAGGPAAAPRTPGALPSGSNRARVTRHHTSVE